MIWNSKCFNLFPKTVRKLFSTYVYGLGMEEELSHLPEPLIEPQTFPSSVLAMETININNTWTTIEQSLNSAFELLQEQCIEDYLKFVEKIHHSIIDQ